MTADDHSAAIDAAVESGMSNALLHHRRRRVVLALADRSATVFDARAYVMAFQLQMLRSNSARLLSLTDSRPAEFDNVCPVADIGDDAPTHADDAVRHGDVVIATRPLRKSSDHVRLGTRLELRVDPLLPWQGSIPDPNMVASKRTVKKKPAYKYKVCFPLDQFSSRRVDPACAQDTACAPALVKHALILSGGGFARRDSSSALVP